MARPIRSICTAFLAATLLGVLVAVVNEWRAAREAIRYSGCRSCLASIAVVLRGYFQEKGHLPPAALIDKAGVPLHSWRTLVMCETGSSKGTPIVWNEPWSSSANSIFAHDSIVLSPFACDPNHKLRTTYFVVTGNETAFRPGLAATRNAFRDGRKNTVLVIEANIPEVLPMCPRDIPIEDLEPMYDNWNKSFRLRNHSSKNPHVIFADFSSARIGRVPDWPTFRALFTIAGGDGMNRTQLEHNGYIVLLDDRWAAPDDEPAATPRTSNPPLVP